LDQQAADQDQARADGAPNAGSNVSAADKAAWVHQPMEGDELPVAPAGSTTYAEFMVLPPRGERWPGNGPHSAPTNSLDNVAQWLAPLSVLVSIWMVIPALTSLGIGLRRVRRTRSQLTAEP
jgi:hypothetical protein